MLAQALGVTKGGFYGYFSDRRALLDEMLDTWERTVLDEVIERVEGDGGDARAKLRRLFALGTSLASKGLGVELAIRDWARRDKAVAKRLKRVDNRRMEFMRTLFADVCRDGDDVEARCLLAFSLFVGSPFITADHDGRSRMDVAEQALEWLAG
jgi:AcrR family transcriptional regulator